MRPDEQGADEYVLTPEQEDRSVALAVARDILLVKGGKYAERPIDPDHLITLATWILGDPGDLTFSDVAHLAVDEPLTFQQAHACRKALARYDRTQGVR